MKVCIIYKTHITWAGTSMMSSGTFFTVNKEGDFDSSASRPTLVQILVYCLFGNKPLSEQVLAYCQWGLNTLRPRQDGRHFPDDIFKWIFFNEIIRISIRISLELVPGGPINNIPTLVQIMAWRRPGDKPLSEPMMVSLLTRHSASMS